MNKVLANSSAWSKEKNEMSRKILILLLLLLLGTATLVYASSDAPFGYQVVRQQAVLIGPEGQALGTAEFWNTQ